MSSRNQHSSKQEIVEGLYQTNMRRVLNVTRTSFEIVPQTQAEMAKLVGEPFASYNKERSNIDQITRAIADGRNTAATAVKDCLTKAIESVGEHQQ